MSWAELRSIIEVDDVDDAELMDAVADLLDLDWLRWKDGDTLTDPDVPDWAL